MAVAKLTEKQKIFVKEYLVDGNASRAAKCAGYSPKTCGRIGLELLTKSHVLSALKEAQERRSIRLDLKADDVLKNILRIADKAEDAGEFGAALKGQELLGKHLVLFTDKKELTGAEGGPVKMIFAWEGDEGADS